MKSVMNYGITNRKINLKCGESYSGGPAPRVHRDEVAGGDGVQLHGGEGPDGDAGDGHRLEQKVQQPRAARLAAVVENIHENRWENI